MFPFFIEDLEVVYCLDLLYVWKTGAGNWLPFQKPQVTLGNSRGSIGIHEFSGVRRVKVACTSTRWKTDIAGLRGRCTLICGGWLVC